MSKEQPLDPKMNELIHNAIKRELTRVEAEVAALQTEGGQPGAGLIRRWQFLSSQVRHHHEGEDTYLWPLARERSKKPAEKVVLDAMDEEHHALARQLDVLDADFAKASNGEQVDLQRIQQDLQSLQQVVDNHFAHEERDGVKILSRYLTNADLTEFNKYNRSSPDSSLVFPWICDGASPADQKAAWGVLPGFVRVIARPIMNRKYAQFLQEVA